MLKVIFGEKDFMAIKNNMEEVGIRPQLWLWQLANGLYMKLNAPYVLLDEEKKVFLQIIKNLKTPSNYVSTLRKKVAREGKLRGLKSHDYHIIIQQVLPLCLCKSM
jgi:hypothetical protein